MYILFYLIFIVKNIYNLSITYIVQNLEIDTRETEKRVLGYQESGLA